MKKFISLLTIFLFWFTVSAIAQTEGTGVQTNQNTITVSVTSGTAKSIWYGFPGRGAGTQGFSETAIDPKNLVYNSGDMVLTGQCTVLSGTEASDSLQGYALPLGPDGYVMGEDTLWFDWDSHTTRTTEQTGADGYLNWTEFSGTLGVTTYTFWINLTNKYPPCWGMKFVLTNNDVLGNMVNNTVLQTGEVR